MSRLRINGVNLHSYMSFHGIPSDNLVFYLSQKRDKIMVQKPAYREALSFVLFRK
jgi:hypothetical protein